MEINDVLILISAGGESKNMINAIPIAKKIGVKKIITFTGNNKIPLNTWRYKFLGRQQVTII